MKSKDIVTRAIQKNQDPASNSTPNAYPANSLWYCSSGEYAWESDDLSEAIDYCLHYILCEKSFEKYQFIVDFTPEEELAIFLEIEQKCLSEGCTSGDNWEIRHDSLGFPYGDGEVGA